MDSDWPTFCGESAGLFSLCASSHRDAAADRAVGPDRRRMPHSRAGRCVIRQCDDRFTIGDQGANGLAGAPASRARFPGIIRCLPVRGGRESQARISGSAPEIHGAVGAYSALVQFARARLGHWTAVLVIHVLRLRIVAGVVLEKMLARKCF